METTSVTSRKKPASGLNGQSFFVRLLFVFVRDVLWLAMFLAVSVVKDQRPLMLIL